MDDIEKEELKKALLEVDLAATHWEALLIIHRPLLKTT